MSITAEPAVGSYVLDDEDDLWTRKPDGLWYAGDPTEGVTWATLTDTYTVRPYVARFAEVICADCGAHGETTGHMGCQYPKDRP